MWRRCDSERLSRSRFQATRQSPGRTDRVPAGVQGAYRAPRWPYLQTDAVDRCRRRVRRRVAGLSSADHCRSTPAWSPQVCTENPFRSVFVCSRHPTGFVESILTGFAGSVKTPWPVDGNHLFAGRDISDAHANVRQHAATGFRPTRTRMGHVPSGGGKSQENMGWLFPIRLGW
jgi:hypothetical protein